MSKYHRVILVGMIFLLGLGRVMELVYLWVDEYKNIKNEGFNFSPKFECSYDKDSHELIIDKNDNYVNIFPDNINVTAIVGENGSGKSSILDLISDIPYENPLLSAYPITPSELIIYYNKVNNKLYIYKTNINIIINNQSSIIEEEVTKESIQKILIYPTPSHTQEEYLLLLNFLISNDISFPFNIPKIISFGIHDDFRNLLHAIENKNFDFYTIYSPFEEDKTKRFKIFHILLLLAYLTNYEIKISVQASKNYDDTILELEKLINEDMIDKIRYFINTARDNLENFSKNSHYYINKKNLKNDFFKIYIEIIKRKNGNALLDFRGKNVFYFDLYPKMSDGQYQLVYLFNMIYSKINENNILLLIDEGENYLHPNWQKNYLLYLIEFLTNNFLDKQVHIILTSHSPFLLSDLPKENVIFLKKGKQVDVDINPFGANIHTLLSHGFFMEGGLMGEFAKGKIDDVIKLLNTPNKLSDNEIQDCENIISIIGEPIIKNQLRKMLDSKRLKKVDEIDKLTEEIELIKHRIEMLRKNQ